MIKSVRSPETGQASGVRLGRTNLMVARLGLGAAPLGNMMGPVSDATARDILLTATQIAGTIVDTAPLYGVGLSEERIGATLSGGSKRKFVLSTKVGRLVKNGEIVEDYSYDGTMRSVEASSQRLGGLPLDIVHVHDPDEHFDEALEGAFRALAELRRNGTIQAVSAGMNQWQMLARFLDHADLDCLLIAGRYSLLDRSAEAELLPKCLSKGVGLMVGGVFNSGILANPRRGSTYDYVAADETTLARAMRLKEICDSYAIPLRAAALQFPLRNAAVSAVLVGVRSIEEWLENARLFGVQIPDSLWAELLASDV